VRTVGQRFLRVSEFERASDLEVHNDVDEDFSFRALSVICKRTPLSLFPPLTNSLSFPFSVCDRGSAVYQRISSRYLFLFKKKRTIGRPEVRRSRTGRRGRLVVPTLPKENYRFPNPTIGKPSEHCHRAPGQVVLSVRRLCLHLSWYRFASAKMCRRHKSTIL